MVAEQYINISKVTVKGFHDKDDLYIHIDSVLKLIDDYKKINKL